MDWILTGIIVYVFIILRVCLHIIYNTGSTTKAFAYVLISIFIPVVGIGIYFSVGLNYRKRKLYSKKIFTDERLLRYLRNRIIIESEKAWNTDEHEVQRHKKLARFLLKDSMTPLSGKNEVKLLLNGEQKFPEVMEAIKNAQHHIHIEYYIYEDDQIGNQLKDLLIQKAKEGVTVRLIYDDFGSRSIRKTLAPELRAAGVQAYPFYEVIFVYLANRLNYRNHRKIIVIDGCIGFVGGINVSDRYINQSKKKNKLYWRDTHIKIVGPGTYYLQYLFICDWNFCSGEQLEPQKDFFCTKPVNKGKAIVQIAASGPDSDSPSIMLALIQAISVAEEELLITTPYFIPGNSIIEAIKVASMSGIDVKLLVPDQSDSYLVNAAARSYYGDLMDAGVDIYLYKKGFIHAKTIVSDGQLAIVGTANMDQRSFTLNFEVTGMIYDEETAGELRKAFYNDIKNAEKIDPEIWNNRTRLEQLPEKVMRLFSPLL
jgi:cardiolipin synthase